MRAFYHFYIFNNLLSIYIHQCREKFEGLSPPQAPDERRLCQRKQ